MAFETFIRYAGLAVGLMVFEKFIRVGLMVFEKFIQYTGLAVGLKPSARGCEGRRRGPYRMMYANTISPRLRDAKPAGAGYAGKTIEAGACPGPKRAWSLGRALCSAPFAPIFRPWPI